MRYFLINLCFFVSTFNTYGTTTQYSDDKNIVSIGINVSIFEDSSNELSIDDVQKLDSFVKSSIETPNLNISQSEFWIKFVLKNNTKANDLLLEIAHPIIDRIDFYEVDGNKIRHEYGSEFEAFGTREYNSPNYIFDLNLLPDEEKTYYLRVKSGEQVLLPLFVGTRKAILEAGSKHEMIFGIYVGIMLIMFLYNLFVYFTVQDKSYLYYIVYIFFVGLNQAVIKGYSFKYLWPSTPEIAILSMYWVSALSGICVAFFVINFLKVKEFNSWSIKGFYIIIGFYCISMILSAFGNFYLSMEIIHVCAGMGSLYTLFIAISIAEKGFRPAQYFLLGWSVFLTAVILYVLKSFGIIPHNYVTNYLLEAGSAIETILLSFALADRINTYKRERIEAIEEKEKILEEQNEVLENQVEERTKALKITLDKLRATQSQLIQSEKMASLGQLTAGMAHEINNPLNYMSQGIEVLKEDINDLKNLIIKYDETLIDPSVNIDDFKEEIQIDYVYKEMDDAVSDIEDGINRTVAITAGLKTFSRINESDFKLANIHHNLDSTTNLMKHEFAKKGIIIHKEYNASITEIECNSGKLNQVFMNILINSTYAISHSKSDQKGVITIHTDSNESHTSISIKDNGCGMSQETQNKLFDPFYTTKDVGEGTGLGMSIVHGIIDNHNGTIKVSSELNIGTEIVIALPF